MGDNKLIIEARNVSKSYNGKKVLDKVCFEIRKGDIYGCLGPNGAGKTTTLKIISGICKEYQGRVNIGKNNRGYNFRVSVVLDYHGLYKNLTAKENLLKSVKTNDNNFTYSSADIYKVLQLVKLDEFDKLKVRAYSRGMMKRLLLAKALINNPDVLIFDEPFDGLDVYSQYVISNFLTEWVKDDERCIVITSHNFEEIQRICNKILIISNGKIVEDASMKELIYNAFKCLRINLVDEYTIESLKILLSGLCEKIVRGNNKNNYYIYARRNNNQIIIDQLIRYGVRFKEIEEMEYSLREIYLHKVND